MGATVSFIGDGVYFVAIAWQAYTISNTPAALAAVGIAWTLPTILLFLIGGAASDRLDRRHVLIVASSVQAIVIGIIALLAIVSHLTMAVLLALVAIYGGAQAFFTPAYEAILPTLVMVEDLPSMSALSEVGRRLALQILGPAIGGGLVALSGSGPALLVDAVTFLAPICALAVAGPPSQARQTENGSTTIAQVREGVRFVASQTWLWGTLLAACLVLLAFFGPYQALLPFLVKNGLHASGATLGLIYAAWGIGAVMSSLALGQRGLPRRAVIAMLAAWALQSLLLAGFALATRPFIFMIVALVSGSFGAAGNVIWATLLKTLVPNHLLGRVSSLDWLASTALIPVSLAITGPIAAALGVRTTLFAAGVLGAAMTLTFLLLLPDIRAPEYTLRRSAGLTTTTPLAQGLIER